ncbi:MAG: hypothetical protein KBC38_03320 [Candidatus Pacebacteria bacterium]|nr:hypothetical protein [Candidatus Paceibacterota bacterium]MBP9840558.1 hypothetical protein [Candidatus Paceibacterota bacterium]
MFEGRLLFSYGDAREGIEFSMDKHRKKFKDVALEILEVQEIANLALERSDNLKKVKVKPSYYGIMTNLIGEKYPDKDLRRDAALVAIGHMFATRAARIAELRKKTGKAQKRQDGPLAETRVIWPRDANGQHHMDFGVSYKHGRR